MTENPKYYWLKLSENFFRDINMRILRKNCGDAGAVIYLNMLLKAISNGGNIEPNGYFDNFYEELAFEFDEDEEICKKVLETLIKQSLIETDDGKTYFLPQALECTGKESASAEAMRKSRQNKKKTNENNSVTHCDNNVTQCDIEKEKEKELEIYSETEEEKERVSGDTAIFLPVQNGEDYPVSSSEIKKWKELYPDVDVEQQLRTIKGWLEANPDKLKQKENMPGYINAWLTRKQESGAGPPKAAARETEKKMTAPSYDIRAVEERMNKTVPKLRKKNHSPESDTKR